MGLGAICLSPRVVFWYHESENVDGMSMGLRFCRVAWRFKAA